MDDTCLSLSPSWLKSPLPLSLTFTSIDPQAPIRHKHRSTKICSNWPKNSDLLHKHWDSFQSTSKHKPIAIRRQQCCSLSLLVSHCMGVFDFWLILWSVRVWVCLIFGWFCCVCVVVVVGLFAMVGLCVVGDAGLHWLVTKIMGWRERVRERERMWGEKKYIESYSNHIYMHGYCSTFGYIQILM